MKTSSNAIPEPSDSRRPARALEADGLPPEDLIRYTRRLLIRHYRIPSADIEDLVAESLLDYLKVPRRRDGLLLTIAHRRACDFWRRRPVELPLAAAEDAICPPAQDGLDAELLERTASRFLSSRNRLDKERLLRVLHEILAGASFSEACRASGVPRGSQPRYRHTLRQCFESSVAPPSPSRRLAFGPAEATPPKQRKDSPPQVG